MIHMEKSEAYELLSLCLQDTLNEGEKFLERNLGITLNHEARGTSGKLYTIQLRVECDYSEYKILGKIHDNNTHRFSILEEEISLKKKG